MGMDDVHGERKRKREREKEERERPKYFRRLKYWGRILGNIDWLDLKRVLFSI